LGLASKVIQNGPAVRRPGRPPQGHSKDSRPDEDRHPDKLFFHGRELARAGRSAAFRA